jgi:hypothetical protein
MATFVQQDHDTGLQGTEFKLSPWKHFRSLAGGMSAMCSVSSILETQIYREDLMCQESITASEFCSFSESISRFAVGECLFVLRKFRGPWGNWVLVKSRRPSLAQQGCSRSGASRWVIEMAFRDASCSLFRYFEERLRTSMNMSSIY